MYEIKYGENPCMQAHLERVCFDMKEDQISVLSFTQPDGKPMNFKQMSSTNFIDLSRALETLKRIVAVYARNGKIVPAVAVAVKHGNPCGAAVSQDVTGAIHDTFYGDPDAIFGGFLVTNKPITEEAARVLEDAFKDHHRKGIILAGVAAPSIVCEHDLFKRKYSFCHLLVRDRLGNITEDDFLSTPRVRYVSGARIVEQGEVYIPAFDNKNCVVGFLTQHDIRNLMLAWAVGSSSNSNSITLVKNSMVIGNGVGQQSRIRAVRAALMCAEDVALARSRADGYIKKSVAYSDSFFSIGDAVEELVYAGVKTIFSTSGSKKGDAQTISICENHGLTLYMEPDKIARGFFGHS